jgi:HEAT repeat protein
MTDKILELVEDKANQSRDLAIDELADLFDGNNLSETAKTQTILRLLETVEGEENPSVIESIYNLFGIAFADSICNSEIAKKCVNMLDRLESGSLAHALPIIADSDLVDRKSLILNYLNSENPAIKKIAKESLQQIG